MQPVCGLHLMTSFSAMCAGVKAESLERLCQYCWAPWRDALPHSDRDRKRRLSTHRKGATGAGLFYTVFYPGYMVPVGEGIRLLVQLLLSVETYGLPVRWELCLAPFMSGLG